MSAEVRSALRLHLRLAEDLGVSPLRPDSLAERRVPEEDTPAVVARRHAGQEIEG
jgi:hypothetical protein